MSYGRLFLNVEGREPEGVVAEADYERVRSELKERLEALGDDQGRPIGTVAHRPEDCTRRHAVWRPTFSSTSAASTGGASAGRTQDGARVRPGTAAGAARRGADAARTPR